MAIRNSVGRVCILGCQDASRFALTGVLPLHGTHQHCGRHKAEQLTSELLFVAEGRQIYAASWIGPGKKAIRVHEQRRWRKVTSDGFATNAVCVVTVTYRQSA